MVREGFAGYILHHQELDPILLTDIVERAICGWFRLEMTRASRSNLSRISEL
jgi:hypothetical protein